MKPQKGFKTLPAGPIRQWASRHLCGMSILWLITVWAVPLRVFSSNFLFGFVKTESYRQIVIVVFIIIRQQWPNMSRNSAFMNGEIEWTKRFIQGIASTWNDHRGLRTKVRYIIIFNLLYFNTSLSHSTDFRYPVNSTFIRMFVKILTFDFSFLTYKKSVIIS